MKWTLKVCSISQGRETPTAIIVFKNGSKWIEVWLLIKIKSYKLIMVKFHLNCNLKNHIGLKETDNLHFSVKGMVSSYVNCTW